jgi:hypothetical protein
MFFSCFASFEFLKPNKRKKTQQPKFHADISKMCLIIKMSHMNGEWLESAIEFDTVYEELYSDHSPWSTNIFDEPYQFNQIVTSLKLFFQTIWKKKLNEKVRIQTVVLWKWHCLYCLKRSWKPTRTRTQNRAKDYFGLSRKHLTSRIVTI